MCIKINMAKIFHLRYFDGKLLSQMEIKEGSEFNRVVTGIWDFNEETNILRYGATVYYKKAANDTWIGKKLSVEQARERYIDCPVLVKLEGFDFSSYAAYRMYKYAPFIITNDFIFKFGVHAFGTNEWVYAYNVKESQVHGYMFLYENIYNKSRPQKIFKIQSTDTIPEKIFKDQNVYTTADIFACIACASTILLYIGLVIRV